MQRAKLVADRKVLHSRTDIQDTQCSAVEEGSATERSCRKSLADLSADVSEHIGQSKQYNDAARKANDVYAKHPLAQMTESTAELVEIFNRAASELHLPKGPATDRDLVRLKCQAYFRAVGTLLARAGRRSWENEFPGLDAGGIANKFAYESQHGGNWQVVDINSAQALANRGAVVVGASPEDASGHGHLGFVIPLPSGIDESRFSGTGPFVRDGNEHVPPGDPKFYPSSWGAVKASKAFSLSRTKWYVFVPSKP
jgi:hypothetical protein